MQYMQPRGKRENIHYTYIITRKTAKINRRTAIKADFAGVMRF